MFPDYLRVLRVKGYYFKPNAGWGDENNLLAVSILLTEENHYITTCPPKKRRKLEYYTKASI